jgi:hypothetical protein
MESSSTHGFIGREHGRFALLFGVLGPASTMCRVDVEDLMEI